MLLRRLFEKLRLNIEVPWARDLYDAYFADWVNAAKPSPRRYMSMRRHLLFFQKLGASYSSREELLRLGLLHKFGRIELSNFRSAYRWMVTSGTVAAVTLEEAIAASQLALQQKLFARVTGWRQDVLQRYHRTLLVRQVNFRKRGWVGPHEQFKDRTITSLLTAAAQFLTSLSDLEVPSVQAIQQECVEKFLCERPGYQASLAPFLGYLTRKERLFRPMLHVTTPPQQIPAHNLLDAQRVGELLRKWHYDSTIPKRTALLGLLMVLYARSADQACKLRRKDFSIRADGTVMAHFGKAPAPLDERTAPIFIEHLKDVEKVLGRRLVDDDFVFPGRFPGRPLSTGMVSYLMEPFGVKPRRLVSTAIAGFFGWGALAYPQILTRYLGLSRQVALLYWDAFSPRVVDEMQQRAGTR